MKKNNQPMEIIRKFFTNKKINPIDAIIGMHHELITLSKTLSKSNDEMLRAIAPDADYLNEMSINIDALITLLINLQEYNQLNTQDND